eukprot:PhM_4_TR2440/c2_g1_i4/m.12624
MTPSPCGALSSRLQTHFVLSNVRAFSVLLRKQSLLSCAHTYATHDEEFAEHSFSHCERLVPVTGMPAKSPFGRSYPGMHPSAWYAVNGLRADTTVPTSEPYWKRVKMALCSVSTLAHGFVDTRVLVVGFLYCMPRNGCTRVTTKDDADVCTTLMFVVTNPSPDTLLYGSDITTASADNVTLNPPSEQMRLVDMRDVEKMCGLEADGVHLDGLRVLSPPPLPNMCTSICQQSASLYATTWVPTALRHPYLSIWKENGSGRLVLASGTSIDALTEVITRTRRRMKAVVAGWDKRFRPLDIFENNQSIQ